MRCWAHGCPIVSVGDRARLEAIIADRNRAQKHAMRARIILWSAERLAVAEVARRAGVGRPAVWRWQRRFAEAGVDGLLRAATRKPGKAPLSDATVRHVVALTCAEPPGEATHWTGRAMARTAAISLRSVQRIWAAHQLQPHRIRSFKRSRDPDFAAKLEAIVGLYVDPPRHAVASRSTRSHHLSRYADRLERGVRVRQGEVIGYVGSSGRSTGPHLHYEILVDGAQVDPFEVGPSLAQSIKAAPSAACAQSARRCETPARRS